MTRVFLFNASGTSRLYGIGNYVDIIFGILKGNPLFCVVLVDFFQTIGEEYIKVEKEDAADRFNCFFTARSLHCLPHEELWGYLDAEYQLKNTDVFHFNTPNHFRLVLSLKEKIGAKVVYTSHFNILKLERDKEETLEKERLVVQSVDHVVCLSDETSSYISCIGSIGKVTILRTPMITCRKLTTGKKTAIRKKLRIGEDALVMLFNGRIERQKGFYDIASVFPGLLHKHPKLVLIVVGDGELSRAVSKYGRFLGSVLFAGYMDRKNKTFVRRLYQIADIFLLPSYNEQISLSLLEAADCSLASVVSDIPAFASFPTTCVQKVKMSKTGKMDLRDLYQKIDQLLTSKALRKSLGKTLRKHCQQAHNEKDFSTALLALYHDHAEAKV